MNKTLFVPDHVKKNIEKNKKGKIESDFLSGKNKMGGGKIKKNYSKGGGVRPTSY